MIMVSHVCRFPMTVLSSKLEAQMFDSQYFRDFCKEDKKHYKNKLTLDNKYKLLDPFSLKNNWVDDISHLPDIQHLDLVIYPIHTSSKFNKKSSTSCKSLKHILSLSQSLLLWRNCNCLALVVQLSIFMLKFQMQCKQFVIGYYKILIFYRSVSNCVMSSLLI